MTDVTPDYFQTPEDTINVILSAPHIGYVAGQQNFGNPQISLSNTVSSSFLISDALDEPASGPLLIYAFTNLTNFNNCAANAYFADCNLTGTTLFNIPYEPFPLHIITSSNSTLQNTYSYLIPLLISTIIIIKILFTLIHSLFSKVKN